MIPAARPRATRSRSSSANAVRCLRSSALQVEGELVARHQVQRRARRRGDLARAGGEQVAVALLHLPADLPQQLDRVADVGAGEASRARRPRRELDQLAVEQPQPHRRVKRGRRDDERERGGLAGAGLAAQEHVALDELDRDDLAELVDADRHRLPQRQRLGARVRPRHRARARERVAAHEGHRAARRVGGVARDAQLAQPDRGRQPFAARVEVLDRPARRDADRGELAGRDTAAAAPARTGGRPASIRPRRNRRRSRRA